MGQRSLAFGDEHNVSSARLPSSASTPSPSSETQPARSARCERAKFDSQFQLFSIEAVHVFSAFQLLASMGTLLAALGIEPSPYARADFRQQSQENSIFNIDIKPLR